LLDIPKFATPTIKMNAPQPKQKSKLSPLQSLIFGIPIGIMLALYGFFMLTTGWKNHQLDQRFKIEGISTPAALIGYKIFTTSGKSSRTGDAPVYAYTTSDGVLRQYHATEYGIASIYGKKKLATKKVLITYLPDNFDNARVIEWYSDGWLFSLILGLWFSIVGVAIFLVSLLVVIKGVPATAPTPRSTD